MTRRSTARALALGMLAAAGSGGALHAAPRDVARVAMDSAVFVEQVRPGNVRLLTPAGQLRRGDRVVTVVTWRRASGGSGFTITNPLPGPIAYQESARDDEEVSVDGGHVWGRLGRLQIGGRLASPEDVTHVRWRISAPSAARGSGRIAYSGIVR